MTIPSYSGGGHAIGVDNPIYPRPTRPAEANCAAATTARATGTGGTGARRL